MKGGVCQFEHYIMLLHLKSIRLRHSVQNLDRELAFDKVACQWSMFMFETHQ